jgi:hypothetical protein
VAVIVGRKSTPGVRNGRVEKKNNHLSHPGDFYRVAQNEIRIVRERPGEGYRHVLTVGDVVRFLDLLPPPIHEFLDGIHAIILAEGRAGSYGGYYYSGVIKLYAFSRGFSDAVSSEFYEGNREFFERLDVDISEGGSGYTIQWTEEQARAFLLLDTLLHEIGHHADRMTSKRRRDCGRGELFAETFARDMLPTLWDRYWRSMKR